MDDIIQSIKVKPLQYYLNGGCYIFAKELQNKVGGNLRYLTLEHHFVLELNNKLYDASGNVTSIYKDSKYITEEEFNSRDKLKLSIKTEEDKGMKVRLSFVTCTLMEAIEEINIMLKQTKYNTLVKEDDLIEYYAVNEDDPDWFDDYIFIFEITIDDDGMSIHKELSKVKLDFEIIR